MGNYVNLIMQIVGNYLTVDTPGYRPEVLEALLGPSAPGGGDR